MVKRLVDAKKQEVRAQDVTGIVSPLGDPEEKSGNAANFNPQESRKNRERRRKSGV